jgi:hypothetical protein
MTNIEQRSEELIAKREKFIVECLNPHEAEMMEFIKEVVAHFNITTKEQWYEYDHLMPDCASKLIMRMSFYRK